MNETYSNAISLTTEDSAIRARMEDRDDWYYREADRKDYVLFRRERGNAVRLASEALEYALTDSNGMDTYVPY